MSREKDKSGKLMSLLNQPFILWFMSTIILGASGFIYTQIQEQSYETRLAIKEEKKARLELNLLTSDIRVKLGLKDKINLIVLNQINMDFSYSPNTSQNKGLRNILIELDGATGLNGIEKFNPIITEKIAILNKASYRLTNVPIHLQQGSVWSNLTQEEKDNITGLENLTDDIIFFYAK